MKNKLLNNFGLVFLGLVLLFTFFGYKITPGFDDNPRRLHGVDTLYTRDSIYVIKFNIENAYPLILDEHPEQP